ncbi:MAG: biotin transporter BioY [Ruminococcus sp.]|uniref:biotin transporter BioY n=1 Tax=Ruminococcus sp. TaxID=41978 RepID=UPI0025F698BF|nr:biotin transporter BioY [Ruminococcus sp.]MCR5600601.1 biotin transporter BioY [Ruminococcus sp.]
MSENISSNGSKSRFTTKELVLTALFAAIITVCAWISIPIGAVPITLHTFGVFCAVGILGGRKGTFSFIVYLLLGIIGLPVFAGFKSGIGVILGPTGGYLIGYLILCLIYWFGTKLISSKLVVRVILMTIGLAVCYLFGTLWFVYVYSKGDNGISFYSALKICVIPFVPFDLIKLVLSLIISDRVKKYIKI